MKKADIEFYVKTAHATAERSKAVRLKVGAVVVTPDGVMATGFNGTPPGWDNCCEYVDEAGNLKTHPHVIHAEANAYAKLARAGVSTKETVLFCTHAPCPDCAKLVASFGVRKLYFTHSYRDEKGLIDLYEHGVELYQTSIDGSMYWNYSPIPEQTGGCFPHIEPTID